MKGFLTSRSAVGIKNSERRFIRLVYVIVSKSSQNPYIFLYPWPSLTGRPGIPPWKSWAFHVCWFHFTKMCCLSSTWGCLSSTWGCLLVDLRLLCSSCHGLKLSSATICFYDGDCKDGSWAYTIRQVIHRQREAHAFLSIQSYKHRFLLLLPFFSFGLSVCFHWTVWL